MKQPKNSNFERMRQEAERRRFAELEQLCETLTSDIAAQAETARRDRADLESKSSVLREALSSQGEAGKQQVSDLEARCEALAADLAERVEAEHHHQTEIAALNDALKTQADAERESAAALEARCEALTTQLASQAETDEQALAKLDTLREALTAEAEAGRDKATAIETQLGSLAERVTAVDESFSDKDRLRQAIAPVLSGALRDAGVDSHDHMASAIAPYIVETVRVEILNSEDELVEAIHPRLGVLIAAAISNAIEELNRKVDEALPVDRWMASIKGRLTGAPPAGFLIDGANEFVLKEAMLIERQSGLLLARERALIGSKSDDHTPDEDLMAGMIAALQSFAEEAYGSSGAGDLRRFTFTTDTVYLRASPTKILAVRCSGVAPPGIESRVDRLLIEALERLRGGEAVDGAVLKLADFDASPDEPKDGISASTIVGRGLGAIAAAFLAIWGHGAVQDAHQERWFDTIERAALADVNLGPFPLSVTQVEPGGPIRVAGLLPDEDSKLALERRLEWIASPLPVELDLAVVAIGTRP